MLFNFQVYVLLAIPADALREDELYPHNQLKILHEAHRIQRFHFHYYKVIVFVPQFLWQFHRTSHQYSTWMN